jgi:multidrug efflux system outer membrane protein
LGGYPHSVPRGLPLQEKVALPDVPEVGIPSQLVERRPDIRSAEENLIAANAQIGVAKSLLFPQVMITAATGGGTTTINGNSFGQTFVSVLPQLVQQIFNAGAARAGVSGAEAAREEALLQYVQSIHQSFGDVSNALVAYERDRESVAADSLAMAAATDSLRLANLRYEGGVTSYLEVLVSQQNAYGAEIDLVQQQLAWRLSVVQLYSALGGGWQEPPPAALATPGHVTPALATPTPAMPIPART